MAENEIKLELPNNIKSALEKIAKEKHLRSYEIKVSPGSVLGDNYMGVVYRIEIVGKDGNNKESRIRLFGKVPHESEQWREQANSQQAFLNEAMSYTDILPTLVEFQMEKGLEGDLFDSYAHCYSCSNKELEEYLLMEDLREHNYVMFDRLLKLDMAHCKLALNQLAKFHALSFALKDQRPELFAKFKSIEDVLLQNREMLNQLDIGVQAGVNLFNGDEKYRQLLKKACENWTDKMMRCADGDLAEPYSVINHGDFWNNNMLFQYENGKPVNVKFLDWQIVRYASPVLDILYYVFICTDSEFRKQHYESLVKSYHDTLSQFMIRLGSDPEKLFPYSALQEQLKKFGYYGLGMAMLALPLIVSTKEDAPDFNKLLEEMDGDLSKTEPVDIHSEKTKNKFTERMTGILKDLMSLGYLETYL